MALSFSQQLNDVYYPNFPIVERTSNIIFKSEAPLPMKDTVDKIANLILEKKNCLVGSFTSGNCDSPFYCSEYNIIKSIDRNNIAVIAAKVSFKLNIYVSLELVSDEDSTELRIVIVPKKVEDMFN